MGYAVQGHPTWTGRSGEFWLNNPPGAGTGKPLQYPCQENSMDRNKRLKDMPEDEPLMLEGIQHATEEERRTSTSSSRVNEVVGPKPKGCSAADVPGSERKVRCCKEKYCIGTWNVRSMKLGKLDVLPTQHNIYYRCASD